MKLRIVCLALAVLGLSASCRARADDAPQNVHILLDVSHAPDAGEVALKSSALYMEWYRRIDDILYGPDSPLPFNIVILSFEPDLKIPAVTSKNVVHVSASYLKVIPDDFRAMLIHELAHVVQHYPNMRQGEVWLVEGIADYVRHKYFEKDIRPTLRMNAAGQLYGYTKVEPFFYGLQQSSANLEDKGYLKSYTVTSTFLFWLESRKDKQIVHELNAMLSHGIYAEDEFAQRCGEPLDQLWAEFVAESKATRM